jgi:ketosteroid isomerase-like protein
MLAVIGSNRGVWVALAVALALGCKGGDGEGAGAAVAPAGASAPGAAVANEARPPLETARVEALVEAWLAAQNEGDFDAYQALYAERFQGVRRSGPRVVRLDRTGWLEDRGRMFARRMRVEVSDLRVVATPMVAQVDFTQRWASGRYEDIGPKRMVVVTEGDDLRIAREEMLASSLLRSDDGAEIAGEAFSFVVEAGPHAYLVLGDGDGIVHGAPEVLSAGEVVVTRAPIEGASSLADAWIGRTVRVGECEATVTAAELVGLMVPHFSQREEGPIAAADAFRTSAVFIGGRVALFDACAGAGYGREAGLSPMTVAETIDDGELRNAALAAFRRLPEYRAIQAVYERDDTLSDHRRFWDDHPWDPRVRDVRVLRHPRTKARFVSVLAAGAHGCGGFRGELWAVFEVAGAEGRTPRLSKTLVMSGGVEEVVDALDPDDDGVLDFVVVTDLGAERALISGTGQERGRLRTAYFDCPC